MCCIALSLFIFLLLDEPHLIIIFQVGLVVTLIKLPSCFLLLVQLDVTDEGDVTSRCGRESEERERCLREILYSVFH